MSHSPRLARHTVSADENWHLLQQLSLASSQTAPSLNLQVLASQQLSLPQDPSPPQSHSSPSSTIPFPHWLPVIVVTPRFWDRQELLTLLRPMAEQIFPIVQGEKLFTSPALGFMIYFASASHVDLDRGQHCEEDSRFWAQVSESQSWTAPNVWPDSWAKICHEPPEFVRTTILVPLTVLEPSFIVSELQSCPSQESPTSLPVGQPLIKVQYALLSLLSPRQDEKRFNREDILPCAHGMFHWAEEGAFSGQSASLTVRFRRPIVMLKERS